MWDFMYITPGLIRMIDFITGLQFALRDGEGNRKNASSYNSTGAKHGKLSQSTTEKRNRT